MRRLLVALLLVAPVAGEGFADAPEDPAAVQAPVQMLLDHFPRLMRLAIDESERDGTPHDAEALAARMAVFFAGFQDRPAWPEQSVAAQTDARASYGHVGALLDVAHAVPDEVGALARVAAGCGAARDADLGQAEAWRREAVEAIQSLDTLEVALQSFATQLRPPLSAAPVHASAGTLRAWFSQTADGVRTCLEEIYIRHNTEMPADLEAVGTSGFVQYMRLVVEPSPAWYGQTVAVSGRVVGPRDQPVLVRGATLGVQRDLMPPANGNFTTGFVVPLEAALGNHSILATSGELSAQALLEVIKAPVTITLTAPHRMSPGTSFPVLVAVHSPLALPAGAVLDINGLTIPAARGRVELRAPDVETNMTVTALYAGDAWHEAAQTSVTVVIAFPPEQRQAEAPIWRLLERGVWYAPILLGDEEGGFASRPGVARGLLLAVTLVMASAVILEFVLSSRRPAPAWEPAAIPTPEAARWPRSFVLAFAALAAFLVRHRILPKGATARDVGRHVHQRGIATGSLVRDFEYLRYGRRVMDAEDAAKRSRWTRWVWKRLGGA